MPAPSLAEFAVKFLICFDNNRDRNDFTEDLCAEAKRLLNIEDPEESGETAAILSHLRGGAGQ